MILEHALIDVTPGSEDAFLSAFSEARQVLAASPGCRSVRLHRGVEQPSRFLLLVEWSDLDAHLVGFRQSEAFTTWRALIGPFFAGAPNVHHYQEQET